jgi:hypothetical protein
VRPTPLNKSPGKGVLLEEVHSLLKKISLEPVPVDQEDGFLLDLLGAEERQRQEADFKSKPLNLCSVKRAVNPLRLASSIGSSR